MSDLHFAAKHLSENTLVGFGSFTISSLKTKLPEFHFITMRCNESSCLYTVNLETGVSYKAGASPNYNCEEKSLQGFMASMASFLKEVVDAPEGEKMLSIILEEGGQDIFWNQYNKMRFLYRDRAPSDEKISQSVAESVKGIEGVIFESFIYKKPET